MSTRNARYIARLIRHRLERPKTTAPTILNQTSIHQPAEKTAPDTISMAILLASPIKNIKVSARFLPTISPVAF